MPDAERIVYFRSATGSLFDGRPMYEGQALIELHCANNGSCHSSGAFGSARHGAPFGLDFDVLLACESGPSCDADDVARLERSRDRIVGHRHAIADAIASGSMPPGAEARALRDVAGEYVRVPLGDQVSHLEGRVALSTATGDRLLPRLDREGRRVLRNWLACGAPVIVSTSRDETACPRPGLECPGASADAPCICAVASDVPPPDPTFTSIFETVLRPLCGVSCHGPGPESLLDDNLLDLSDRALAYSELVGVEAAGVACATMATRVVPGDPASSLLIQKLSLDTPACGVSMPLDRFLLPAEYVDPIRTWITNGAADD
jgi:hypothetical protein